MVSYPQEHKKGGDILKKIGTFILSLLMLTAFASCNFNSFYESSITKEYSEVDSMSLLNFLNENISSSNTLDEIIDVFEEMCQTPIEDDGLLLEYGVYDFTGEEWFYFDLVRQYPDGEDEFYQLRVSLTYAVDGENSNLKDALWSDDTSENFFDYIRKSAGYKYAKDNKIKSVDIRIDQT